MNLKVIFDEFKKSFYLKICCCFLDFFISAVKEGSESKKAAKQTVKEIKAFTSIPFVKTVFFNQFEVTLERGQTLILVRDDGIKTEFKYPL